MTWAAAVVAKGAGQVEEEEEVQRVKALERFYPASPPTSCVSSHHRKWVQAPSVVVVPVACLASPQEEERLVVVVSADEDPPIPAVARQRSGQALLPSLSWPW